jgi:hypothetical protein
MLTEVEILLQERTLKIHPEWQQLLTELADYRGPGRVDHPRLGDGARLRSQQPPPGKLLRHRRSHQVGSISNYAGWRSRFKTAVDAGSATVVG